MVKRILEDIKIIKKEKSYNFEDKILDLPVNKAKSREENYQGDIKESKIEEYFKTKTTEKRIERTPQLKKTKKVVSRPVLIIFIICFILGGLYWGGNFFQKANIEITSKHQQISYNKKPFMASKDKGDNSIDFEIMIVSDQKSQNFILTEPKNVSEKASGVITFYNQFATTSQKLLAGTFLADNTGKTYKTNEVVTIPGYKLDASKKIIPGQADVNISAFLPGETYNGSSENFFITSFKGTAKYNKISAKLKTPLSGGMTGTVYTLNENDKIKINTLAGSSFKNDLFEKVNALIPDGYIVYPNATSFSYNIEDNAMSKTPDAKVQINGTLAVVLLKEKSLIDTLIKTSLPNAKGDELKEISISDLSKLVFNFTNKDQVIAKDLNQIAFSLTGDIDAIWTPNIELLKTKLVGTPKTNVLNIFRQEPGISSAIVKIFPPWQKNIPTDVSKINIVLR